MARLLVHRVTAGHRSSGGSLPRTDARHLVPDVGMGLRRPRGTASTPAPGADPVAARPRGSERAPWTPVSGRRARLPALPAAPASERDFSERAASSPLHAPSAALPERAATSSATSAQGFSEGAAPSPHSAPSKTTSVAAPPECGFALPSPRDAVPAPLARDSSDSERPEPSPRRVTSDTSSAPDYCSQRGALPSSETAPPPPPATTTPPPLPAASPSCVFNVYVGGNDEARVVGGERGYEGRNVSRSVDEDEDDDDDDDDGRGKDASEVGESGLVNTQRHHTPTTCPLQSASAAARRVLPAHSRSLPAATSLASRASASATSPAAVGVWDEAIKRLLPPHRILLSLERRRLLSVTPSSTVAGLRAADLSGLGSIPSATGYVMASWVAKVFGAAGRKEKAPKNQHSKTQAFPFRLLQQATDNFDDLRVIGCGGFGKVYMAVLAGDTKVALKRKNLTSLQGQKEFRMEIELMPGLNHRNLVSLIGYCEENNEMILVYEYMERGTLTSHLYGSDKPSLDWKQRLEVCIGAAKGLHYLHTNSAKAIIHCDVKSANILLDERFRAKVGDFGISKTGPELDQTHVTTEVKGSFGYLDPEYCRTQQLTEKSDVYSFGVVLLEVLCARPVIDPKLPREKVNLVEWGIGMLKKGKLKQIVDPKISGTIKPRSLKVFGEIVAMCLAETSVERPSMEDVLMGLKYVRNLEVKNAFIGKICRRTSNVPDGLSDPSTSRVSPVLDESISAAENSDQSDHDVSSGNSDEDDHDVSAGNSYESDNDLNAENLDESDHDVSAQLIKLGGGKALTRSLGTVFSRDSNGPDDLSDPSMSQVSPVIDGNTMNGTVGLQDIVAHDNISVAGNSDESDHFSTSLQGARSPDESYQGVSSQLIQLGESKALTRSLAFRRGE